MQGLEILPRAKAVACLLLGLLAPAAAYAERIEASYFVDLPIVLTPSRLPQPQNEAPAAVTVIDREMIRATGYEDIPRLLRLVPGMQVGQERGGKHWVTYHGMGNDYPSWMQVLVDGRSVFSPANFDGVDWSSLPVTVDDIERIEVVRGTNSTAYGSNAVLGVVNIITRHSGDLDGSAASVSAGNQGRRGGAAQWRGAGERGSVRLNASFRGDDGFDDLHDSHRTSIVSLRGDYRPGNRDELTALLGASRGQQQLGYADSLFNNNGEREADFSSTHVLLQWRHTPRSIEEWSFSYYHNNDEVTEAWQAAAPPLVTGVPLDRNRESQRDSVEFQHRLSWSDAVRTVWGGELRRDAITAPFLYAGQPDQHQHLGRLFGQIENRLTPSVTTTASGLVERFDDHEKKFSPRFFVNWQASRHDAWRAGYARAWRGPFIFERRGDVQVTQPGFGLLAQPYAPNIALQPSRMDSIEIGYLGEIPDWDARVDVRLFRERIDGYIARAALPSAGLLGLPTARYENLATPVELRGVEYQIDHRPWAGGQFLFSHALIDRRSDDTLVRRLTAAHTASLSYFQNHRRWSGALSILRMGSIAGGSGFVPTTEYASPGYHTVDFRLAYALEPTVEIALAGINIGPRHQEIADRSEQALHGTTPVNLTSPMVWLTISVRE
ncbi:MAG TPA: TonB-dependent receptor [Rhodocyclaceae bacterium]